MLRPIAALTGTTLLALLAFGCLGDGDSRAGDGAAPPRGASAPRALTPAEDKAFPNFPLRYRGSGYFVDTANPAGNFLAQQYIFDMERGVNREVGTYIDREQLIFNVYDLDPSDGTDPDREYFVQKNPATGQDECVLNPFPLPNVFRREWWLQSNMHYVGTETINGFAADCWEGELPGAGLPAKFCNRADRYPDFAPVLKKIATFEFRDHYGEALSKQDAPEPSFFKLPHLCRDL
jgi:hypothetical protein